MTQSVMGGGGMKTPFFSNSNFQIKWEREELKPSVPPSPWGLSS